MREKFAARVQEMFGGRLGPDDYDIHVRVYGRDGVMGKLEPLADQVGHEVALLFTITTAEEASTDAIAKTFAHFALHYPIPGMARSDQRHRVPDGAVARESRAGLSFQPESCCGAGRSAGDVSHRISGGLSHGQTW